MGESLTWYVHVWRLAAPAGLLATLLAALLAALFTGCASATMDSPAGSPEHPGAPPAPRSEPSDVLRADPPAPSEGEPVPEPGGEPDHETHSSGG